MSQPKDPRLELDEALAKAAIAIARELAESQEHPSIGAMIDYQAGKLDAAQATQIEQHLSNCAECAEDIRSLDGFDPHVKEDPRLVPDSVSTSEDWQELQRRLGKEDLGGRPTAIWLLAASIAALTLALLLWTSRSGRPPATWDVVKVQPYLVDLFSDTEGLQRSGTVQAVEPPVGTDVVIFRLILQDLTPHNAYRCELLAANGTSIFVVEPLHRQPTGEILLMVPTERLDTGTYILRLLVGQDATRPHADYTFAMKSVENSQ